MDRVLDAKGVSCPIPVIKTRLAINEMDVGEVITVLATDPASAIDIRHFCNVTGNPLLDSTTDDSVYRYVIRKDAP
ncbi:MAG: sulfurtransferase TusA family protein [Rhodospirillales bacterium]